MGYFFVLLIKKGIYGKENMYLFCLPLLLQKDIGVCTNCPLHKPKNVTIAKSKQTPRTLKHNAGVLHYQVKFNVILVKTGKNFVKFHYLFLINSFTRATTSFLLRIQ